MTIIHEKGNELHWKDVRELVVGEYTASAEDRARPLEVLLFPVSSTGNVQKTVLENREHGEHGSIDFETTLVHSSHC